MCVNRDKARFNLLFVQVKLERSDQNACDAAHLWAIEHVKNGGIRVDDDVLHSSTNPDEDYASQMRAEVQFRESELIVNKLIITLNLVQCCCLFHSSKQ